MQRWQVCRRDTTRTFFECFPSTKTRLPLLSLLSSSSTTTLLPLPIPTTTTLLPQTAMSFEKEHTSSNPSLDNHNANIVDLNARRRAALAEVDNAAFGFFHVKACLVAGVGFFTGASRCSAPVF